MALEYYYMVETGGPMVFSVSCPECHASFPVDGEKVPESGVRARCSECEGVFYVQHPEVSDVEETQSPEIETMAEAPEAVAMDDDAADDDAIEVDDDAIELTAAADSTGDEALEAAAAEALAGDEATEALASDDAAEVSAVADEVSAVADASLVVDAVIEAADEHHVVEHPSEQAMQAVGAQASEEVAVQAPPLVAFGKADPEARAARLARVLVSDMMTYNPKLYEQAQEQGTLATDFEDEVKKSWSEYVDQVGEDLAHSTSHFMTALNDILAKGEAIFDQTMYR